MYLGIKDGIILRFAQLAREGQSQQMAVCLGEQDGSSSVEGQPQQMAVCLVEQDGRSSVLSLSKDREREKRGGKQSSIEWKLFPCYT